MTNTITHPVTPESRRSIDDATPGEWNSASHTYYQRAQPAPKPSSSPAIWSLVIKDMVDRDLVGKERYGHRLQGGNGRDALVDAYQEALDLACYLRQVIWERDNDLTRPGA